MRRSPADEAGLPALRCSERFASTSAPSAATLSAEQLRTTTAGAAAAAQAQRGGARDTGILLADNKGEAPPEGACVRAIGGGAGLRSPEPHF